MDARRAGRLTLIVAPLTRRPRSLRRGLRVSVELWVLGSRPRRCAPRAPAFRRLRPIRRRTLRALTTHVLPDRLHSHDDARAGPRVHRRSLGATIIVANLVDAFPAVLAPIFGIRIVHGLSSSLGFDAFPAPSRKEKANYPRLSKQLRAKATLVSTVAFHIRRAGSLLPSRTRYGLRWG